MIFSFKSRSYNSNVYILTTDEQKNIPIKDLHVSFSNYLRWRLYL